MNRAYIVLLQSLYDVALMSDMQNIMTIKREGNYMAEWEPINFTADQEQAFEECRQTMFAEISRWSSVRNNTTACLVSEIAGLQGVLEQGYRDLIAAFKNYDTKQNLPPIYRKKQHEAWSLPAALMIAEAIEILGNENARNIAAEVIKTACRDYKKVSGRSVAVLHEQVREMLQSLVLAR